MAEDKTDKTPRNKDEEAQADDDFFINDSTSDNTTDKSKDPTVDPAEELHSDEPSGKELDAAMNEAEQEAAQPPDDKPAIVKPGHRWSRKKIILIAIAAVVGLIAILMAIPLTRYAIAGLVVKRDVVVTLLDSKTDKPVSSASVTIGGLSVTTDAKGVATLKSVPVGSKQVKAVKKHYKDARSEVLVPILGANPTLHIDIEATGRQVPVKIINKVSGQPIEGAQIAVDGTSSKTDKNGEAVIVLPADQSERDAVLSLEGYNQLNARIVVTEQSDDKNTFTLTPSGRLYFLSKRSGKIDVLSSNLDGSDVKTVLAGTGKEDNNNTSLLASRDWKYLALKARRDSDRPKLYSIETNTGKLSVIDEGDVEFTSIGWYNTHFIYKLHRDKLKNWEPKQYALKSFNASSNVLSVLDETAGDGDASRYATEYFSSIYILNNELVYQKEWAEMGPYAFTNKNMIIGSVRPDGGDKKILKSFVDDHGSYFAGARLYKPQEVYYEVYQNSQRSFWEYEDAKLVEDKDMTSDKFYNALYPTFLISPSGKNTFWSEARDGKNTLFVGDPNGADGKEIATLSDYTPYGWYGENYLLVSKGGSELYVISRNNPGSIVKITDYHKPQFTYYGYGYGYGGL